ncbi:Hypothetical_protein [Hexamita inflata]|uniref:Hypothetical_protein n=1 Tax=Hexamita inflata TaxID=28002 RepID=A0AA86S2E4_9EUKA|nr:Hypothetical protein HINF_LOCUS64465 [Hexamita inflata]
MPLQYIVCQFACLTKLYLANHIAPPVITSASNWSSPRFLPKVVGTHTKAGYSHLKKMSLQIRAAFCPIILGSPLKYKTSRRYPQKQTKMYQLSCASLRHRHLSDRAQTLVFFADIAVAVLHFLVLCFRLGQEAAYSQPHKVILIYYNAVSAITDVWLCFRKAITQWLRNKLKYVLIFVVGSSLQECNYGFTRIRYTKPAKRIFHSCADAISMRNWSIQRYFLCYIL